MNECISEVNTFQTAHIIMSLYTTIIWSLLECYMWVLSPHLEKNSVELENVQKRAAKIISNWSTSSLTKDCKVLGFLV